MNIGWIKLHRQFKDWEWYNKSEMVHLFIHCLIKSNFKEGNFQGIEVEKGSFITSIKHLSDETNISIQTVRTCLKKLQLTKEIDVKSTNKLTKITICKYDSYQYESNEANKQLTNNQQTTNKQLTTIEEYKESKEEKRNKSFDIFWNIYDKKVDTKKCREKFLKLTDDEVSIILNVVKKYVDSKTDKQFLKNPLTWLNGKCWNDSIINSVETKISCEDEYMINVMKQVNANKLL
jgi:hypothetical protein